MMEETEIKAHSMALGIQNWKSDYFNWVSGDVIKGSQLKNKDHELSFRYVESELGAKSRCSVKSSKLKTEAQIQSPDLPYRATT